MEIVSELSAPRSVVGAYHIDANRRLRWQSDTTSVENRASSHGRRGVGWESHCDHGSYRMNHRMIDFQPLDYISMETVSVGTSLAKPPSGRVTFAMQDLPGGRCKVSMRMRAADRGILTKLMLSLLGWLPKKQWRDHYRVLARRLRDDMAHAVAASEIVASRPSEIRQTSGLRQ